MTSKTIFVANLPFDVSEEQLNHVFSQAGPVASVEIKVDTGTGRSKGYAFVHYHDHTTAASAVRNLHEVLVNGRNLRVEMSSDGPNKRGGRGGGDAGGGGRNDRGPSGPPMGGPGRGLPGRPDDFGPGPYGAGPPGRIPGPDGGAAQFGGPPLPTGQDLPPGVSATDAITRTLAGMPPGQLEEVLGSMKTLVDSRPDEAAAILNQKPQLAYALMQSMVLLNIHPPTIIDQLRPPSARPPPPTQSFPPPRAAAPGYPPSYPPAPAGPPMGGYSAPPPQAAPYPSYGQAPAAPGPAPIPPHAQAAIATLPEDQRATLIQVLQMTPEQINQLDPTQRASINELRRQFLQ